MQNQRQYEKGEHRMLRVWAYKLDKERNEKLEAFVSGLTLQKEMGLDFENDLVTYESTNKIEEHLIRIRQECMR